MEKDNLIFANINQENHPLEEDYAKVSLKTTKCTRNRIPKNLSFF
jgi:hypothetical protein